MSYLCIEVTEEDQLGGQPRSTTTCPIARAIERTIPDISYVSVNAEYVSVKRNGWYFKYRTSRAAEQFIRQTDKRFWKHDPIVPGPHRFRLKEM